MSVLKKYMALFSSFPSVYHPLPPEDRASARHFPTSYASVNTRSMAAVVDLLFLALMLYPSRFLMKFHPKTPEMIEAISALERDVLSGTYEGKPGLLKEMQLDLYMDQLWIYVPVQMLCMVPMIAAFLLCWRYYGTTPGKWLFGLRIVNAVDGGPLSWAQCLKRGFFGYSISLPPFMLGILWAHFNKRRRGWHDYIGDTVVLSCKSKYLKEIRKQQKTNKKLQENTTVAQQGYSFEAAESDSKEV